MGLEQRAQMIQMAAQIDGFKTLLSAAQDSLATAAATVAADGGASGTSKSQTAAANTLVQALNVSLIAQLCYY